MSEVVEVPVGWPTPAGGWPAWLWSMPFDGSRDPGTGNPSPIGDGGNCQRYAYGVLAQFGYRIGDLRSSRLWADTDTTSHVRAGDLTPLDLVLFNDGADPFGAHVGLVMATDQVLHLSREVGRPAIWSFADFAARPRYATLLGGKRPIRPRLVTGSRPCLDHR